MPKSSNPRWGVLVLHGFTGHLKTVEGIKPYLKKHHLKYQFPVLRGHGTRFRDLVGVTDEDWYADAEKALLKLAQTVDKVVVVGLSMGGLIALKLGIHHPECVAGVVSVAAALKFKNPLAPYVSLLSRLIPYWPSPKGFIDPIIAKQSKNYSWFPTATFTSLFKLSKKIDHDLKKLKVPLLVLHSKKDQVIDPKSATSIYEKASSKDKTLQWFEKSGHEMMQDLEAKKVFEVILEFVSRLQKKKS